MISIARRTFWRLTIAAAFALALPAQAPSQDDAGDFPKSAIKFVVPNPPGGGNDVLARMIAEKLRVKWGQPVVVENRGGAAGNIGAAAVFNAEPDGHTLLITTPAPLVTNRSLYAKLSYNPDAFVPVSVVMTSPNLLVVHPQVPATSVQQLLAYAKANPDKLSYASQGAGTGAHLTTEMMKMATGVKIVHVPYGGTAPALIDLLAGRVDMMFIAFGDALSYVRSGKLRAIAVGSNQPNPLLPDVAPVAEALPGFFSMYWVGVVAPPRTPAAVAGKLSAGIGEAINQPDLRKKLQDMNVEPLGSTPAEMADFVRQESDRWGKVIQSIGAKVQ